MGPAPPTIPIVLEKEAIVFSLQIMDYIDFKPITREFLYFLRQAP